MRLIQNNGISKWVWIASAGFAFLQTNPAAFAATLVVTNSSDTGPGSLRSVIASAASGDKIVFDTRFPIQLTSGSILINKSLTIKGRSYGRTEISGGDVSNIFTIAPGNKVYLRNLALTHGRSATGGAVFVNGSGSHLEATYCVFSHNKATGNGGAISAVNSNSTSITLVNSAFFENTAGANGGAVDGPGIFLTVWKSTFAKNSATNGGAISIGTGSLYVENSTFNKNKATGVSGAINSDFHAVIVISFSTIDGNTAGVSGGGINSLGTFGLKSSIVALNTAPTAADILGAVVSFGQNVIGDGTGSTGFIATDKVGTTAAPVNPLLGSLRDNGGLTWTQLISKASPAFNASVDCTDVYGFTVTTDQRGVVRPQGFACDTGAVERR